MSLKARVSGKVAPIDHPCSFQPPLCLWDMDEAPASVWGQTPGEVLGWLRTAFSVYNSCRVVAYNGSTSILTPKGNSAPVPGSHARLIAQLAEVSKLSLGEGHTTLCIVIVWAAGYALLRTGMSAKCACHLNQLVQFWHKLSCLPLKQAASS